MKIVDIKSFVVDCFRTNWVFVKVYTDEGIDGVGEGTLEYKEKALVGAVERVVEGLQVLLDSFDVHGAYHSTGNCACPAEDPSTNGRIVV